MKTIDELREDIDKIDKEIVKMLIDRMDISRVIGSRKMIITDKNREMKVILNVLNTSKDSVNPVFLRELYELIIAESKRIQIGSVDK